MNLETIYNELILTTGQTKPFVLLDKIYEKFADLEFSIVMPIHNQGSIIRKILESVIQHTKSVYEMIIILDNCTDSTESIVCDFFDHVMNPIYLKHTTIIKQETPIFETACDNIGFKLACGKYIIEIQADIYVLEDGYEQRLARPTQKISNVIGVSGRCCHNFYDFNGYGKLGALAEVTLDKMSQKLDRNKFYSMETCNRGPLLLCRSKLKEMNYLDEKNFYLNDSDHDLFARAYYQKGYICGYVPIEVITNLSDGSTRKPRDSVNQSLLNERASRSDGGFFGKLHSIYTPKPQKIYDIQKNSYFVTFYGGNKNYYDMYGQFVNYKEACDRLINQAKSTELFDEYKICSDLSLKNDEPFWSKHGTFIEKNQKGSGYWIWKPYIILKTLSQMRDGDILIYCDAGCEIDKKNKSLIEQLFEQTDKDLIVGSYVGQEWGCEKCWCKKDLVKYVNIDENDPIMCTQQHQATAICFKKCEKVLKLVEEWYSIACEYHLLDDTPSVNENYTCFREHRHDQSIFSLLTKKYKIYSQYSVKDAIYLWRTKNGVSRI